MRPGYRLAGTLAASVIAAICALAILIGWSGDAGVALAPFLASKAALWSTIGIFFGSLGIVSVMVALCGKHLRRERETVDFVSSRIKEAASNHTKFFATASDISKSGLLGDDDPRIEHRSATSSGRVIALLFTDARFFRYQPVHLAVRAEATALHRFSRSISGVQIFAIRAGVLGTFIGLILSLARVQEVFLLRGTESASRGQPGLASDMDALREEIGVLVGDVVQGLALAFGTSIAGILAAILIAFVAAFVRWRETKLALRIEQVGQESQLFFRQAFRGNEELVRTADELRGAIKDNLHEMEEARAHLHLHSERLSKTAGEVGTGLADPVRLLAKQSADIRAMLEHGREAAQQVDRVAKEMRSIETMSSDRLTKLSDQLDQAVRSHSDRLLEAVDQNRTVLAEGLQGVSSSLNSGPSSSAHDLANGLGSRVEAGLREGVSEALAGLTRQTEDALREGLTNVQAEGRRTQRFGLLLQAAALGTVALAGVLALNAGGEDTGSDSRTTRIDYALTSQGEAAQ